MSRAFEGLIVVGLAFALGAFALAQSPKGQGILLASAAPHCSGVSGIW